MVGREVGMFPPENAMRLNSFVKHGVPVDVVQIGGTRVYYPIAADWMEEEVRASRRRSSPQRSDDGLR
jgi:hypothetical protein